MDDVFHSSTFRCPAQFMPRATDCGVQITKFNQNIKTQFITTAADCGVQPQKIT